MKKFTFYFLFGLAVCFGFGCDNKSSENYSTSTEKAGSSKDDKVTVREGSEAIRIADSAEISTGAPTTSVYVSDAEFVTTAASGGMLEVKLGKVAFHNGAAAEVKKFGDHMVTDHTKALHELNALADKKNWTFPIKMNAGHQAAYDRISKLSGKDFDREYMNRMVKDHEKTVALFELANQKATDTELKSFASKTLPTLRMHLDMARESNNKVKGI